MDALQFVKEWDRMCKSTNATMDCRKCVWGKQRSWIGTCQEDVYREPEKAIAVLKIWVENNPRKTIMQDFFEKYPNAKRSESGEPRFCVKSLGYESNCANCFVCWNRPLEE